MRLLPSLKGSSVLRSTQLMPKSAVCAHYAGTRAYSRGVGGVSADPSRSDIVEGRILVRQPAKRSQRALFLTVANAL
jgi:hypothetical protein